MVQEQFRNEPAVPRGGHWRLRAGKVSVSPARSFLWPPVTDREGDGFLEIRVLSGFRTNGWGGTSHMLD